MHSRANIRGFTLQELVVVIIVAVVLAALVLPTMNTRTDRRGIQQMKDSTQITQAHKGMLVLAGEHADVFPCPSRIASRLQSEQVTTEDHSLNHSASLYSMLIARSMVLPEYLVSPAEVNPAVVGLTRETYNYNAYNPTAGAFWDPKFVMRLDDPTIGANASYAHAALCGDRVGALMNLSSAPFLPIIGTRGVRGGVGPGHPDHDNSLTLQLFGSPKTWEGNICFSDHHVEFLSTFTPPGVTYRGSLSAEPRADNIFVAEFAHPRGNQAAADAFLGIFTEATKDTVKDVYDTDAMK